MTDLNEQTVKCVSEDEPSISDTGSKNDMQEFESRAVVMRKRIEQKLDDIEAEILIESQELDERNENLNELPEIIQNRRFMDTKRSRSFSLVEMKDTAISRLREELDSAQTKLKLKDEEVSKLSRIRDEVGSEIEDLTASLFEEANNMVQEANLKRVAAEKIARETSMKLSILQEEVSALKNLIKSAVSFVPSQVQPREDRNFNSRSKMSPSKKNILRNKSPSCSDLPLVNQHPGDSIQQNDTHQREKYEPDPVLHKEFVAWRQNPRIDKFDPFLKRVYIEDIEPCMNFENKELADKVLASIEENRIVIEKICGKPAIPKMCDLLKSPRFCYYRMNLGEGEDYYISALSRNRIAAICDFFSYLRYIENGLIKSSIHEVYLEVLRKRKAIVLARLGLSDDSVPES